ncbi:App1 family protein [Phytohalomonas tamaricis]|uniref:App1 family protein n=1 Tax=Phytohalomonas tamaricis TaxID=2081032 RepID=UPI000D0B0657|nr:phosphatase domain-containing protein [Phytohalomonas tamaricis]
MSYRPAHTFKSGLKKLMRIAAKPMKSERAHGGRVIHTYRGYGSHKEAFLMGRVFRQPGFGLSLAEGSTLQDIVDIGRRTIRWGVKNTDVTITLGASRTVVTTDRDGYFHAHIALDHALPTNVNWHIAELETVSRHGTTTTATAEIYIPPASVDIAIISDIDDTVMYTGVANKLKMMYRLFIEKADQRTAFPGVAAFYQGLYVGRDGDRKRPLLYVSRAPWSIYEVLEEFFNANNIPVGPVLFLREWGLTLQRPLPPRAEDHKETTIKKMLELYADLPFVLIGDSGQHDPEIYTQIVKDHPGRITAIYIRKVDNDAVRDEAIKCLANEVAGTGCTLVLAPDSATMAEHAFEQGYISAQALEDVRREC